ncbi:unnamed protein product [Rotaria magnacalcarata]|uniref:Uncharacterized protein n=1 Tax=Rotaria magnacalcarata TaxID=392030 RepID=A0A814X4L6_9BILA|nr:unnamed protein product [Rotaria magnacalcarata]CAF1393293.1 unnamed protein product [Rotaria magnacalcarata]CAF2184073.1 unnamed protein product [Rotaria magnacalcarata]CAF4039678.1 unnamed protein product [Rotaria magnacalcarata]CAF4411523.1 unnamed protein product [Rotaria magnacalcarata]
MTTDPTTGYDVSLREEDIANSIHCNVPIIVRLDGIQFMLRAFDTVDNCFEAIENNADKRLFIITSGSKGRMLVPALKTNFPEHITRNYPMYIFCGNMHMIRAVGVEPAHMWAEDFVDDLIMFNHEHDLLARILLDTADYFTTKGDQLNQENKLESARHHYQWAQS